MSSMTAKQYLRSKYTYTKLNDDLGILLHLRETNRSYELIIHKDGELHSLTFPNVTYQVLWYDCANQQIDRDKGSVIISIQETLYASNSSDTLKCDLMSAIFVKYDFDEDGNLLKDSYDRMIDQLALVMENPRFFYKVIDPTTNQDAEVTVSTSLWVDQMRHIKDEQQG